ncbi:hypothetical protein [Oceaniglobus roseus]|uniref:COG3904 family protein n=1 Tax=Oceaniglobus roseus TaxID=1737570 RepID=UPI000C7F6095|nr:hypothetical protein [Kandeliimicrobium roseum]
MRLAPTPGPMIKGILGLQLGLAALMFGGDISRGLSTLTFAPAAPGLDTPTKPGDQTRRYRPGDVPQGPPNRPFPAPTEMPERLMFQDVEREGTRVLRLTGEIAEGDAERFAAHLEASTDTPATVILNSSGGSVSDALAIGRTLREAGLSTEMTAGDVCLSACPYILASGVERRVDKEAYVGVHQHYFGENTALPAFLAVADIQAGQGEVMAYLDEMGIDPMVMRHALVTPPDRIYILTEEELRTYRLVRVEGEGASGGDI